MDVDIICQKLHDSNIVDNVYVTSVILEGELSSADVGNNYGKLQFAFNNFQNILKKLTNNKKCLLDPNDKIL